MLLTLYSLSAAVLVAASPVVLQYPLDEQLPPIARVDRPFSWSFSPQTFGSEDSVTLVYTTDTLPAWLAFDPTTRTLSGTPSGTDKGTPSITITATDPSSSNSASSSVDLCVTPFPPPELKIPLEQQFYDNNPSLSSVFFIHNSSALYSSQPALRVPPKWSFSIGFEYDTFSAQHSLYYAATQADGSPLPRWIVFDEHAMTFNGVTPQNLSGPHTVPLLLHASDQRGYTAQSVRFDIVVAAHDFSLGTSSLPTINVTAAQPFQLTLSSAVDFSGVLIDEHPVSPDNITSLIIDTSDLESWLRYNPDSKTLSGEPPSDFERGVLPVILISSVNQTLNTDVTIAAVPSFFSKDDLDPILVNPGDPLTFSLVQYFSNRTGLGKNTDIELSAAYEPLEASDYLRFDSSTTRLAGTVPSRVSYDHVSVTFTAYSHITHSTSHITLPVSLSSSDYENVHDKQTTGGLSSSARKSMLLGLKIAFGIICGFVNLAIIFAMLRRCSRVPDTAVQGEEGRTAWSAQEMKWYGIGIEVNGEKCKPPHPSAPGGWSEGVAPGSYNRPQDNGLSTTLSRVLTRTLSNVAQSPLSPVGHPQSPGMIKKVEFMGRLRATARIVSNKYRRVVSGPQMPVISKPTLILTDKIVSLCTEVDGLPNAEGLLTIHRLSQQNLHPFDETNASQYAPSAISSLEGSPSTSTGARSIPRRRADFAPPKAVTAPPQAHFNDHDSVDSLASSLATNSSSRTHEAEAVVQTATRAMSVRSAVSGSSFQAEGGRRSVLETARPRLVPFTSATRVPVPKLPSSFFSPDPNTADAGRAAGTTKKRVVSQMAKVFRNASPIASPAQGADELRTGIEYVRALGDTSLRVSHAERSPATSVISFSSPESLNQGHLPIPRMLARAGERFNFRISIALVSGEGHEVRLVSGRALPKFIQVEVMSASEQEEKQTIELWGVPVGADVGEYEIGVYTKGGGKCVGRVVVEIVERKSA